MKRWVLAGFALGWAAGPWAWAQEPLRDNAPEKQTMRPEIRGRMGIVAAGRSLHFHNSFFNHIAEPGVLEIESRIPVGTRTELERRGHILHVLGPYGVSTGV